MRRVVGVLLIITMLWAPIFGGAVSNSRILRVGARGPEVHSLQRILVDLGYEVAADGIFGLETEGVVKEIQKVLHLPTDGVVGSQTLSALNELHRSIFPYTVQAGDNLSKLARRYNTTVTTLANCNGLANPDRVFAGQILLIPPPSSAPLGNVGQPPKLIWPCQGPISSPYGYRLHPISGVRHFHGGLDIAVAQGTPVRAAAAGQVVQAGSMGNYGLGVVIEHGGGYTTWYGHNSQVLVRPGERVSQGQIIACSGQSGLATGPHLDFRIKRGDQTLDPLERLP